MWHMKYHIHPEVPVRHVVRASRALVAAAVVVAALTGCGAKEEAATPAAGEAAAPAVGQSNVKDDESMPDVVKVAVGSKDHTTLVAALQAANLVNALSNAGPFTVFAPTNAAFDQLPKGTVETLVKPENKAQLTTILYHHVTTSALELSSLTDGQELGMVDGTTEKITKKGEDTYIGGAKVIASVRASNGWVHVIDAVLVPAKK
jgi:uncharacterized surface protein with fasciclin (FAS1) repeats